MKNLDFQKIKDCFCGDFMTSVAGILVLVHAVYPNANGADVIKAFQDGTWMSAAINIAFAFALIRTKNADPKELPK